MIRVSALPVEHVRGGLWGVDHGQVANKVLVTGPNRSGIESKLIWSPGATYWSGGQGNRYSPAHLGIYRNSQASLLRMTSIYDEGGRLSRAVLGLPKVHQAIVAEWGHEVIPLLDPKVMVVVS